MRQSALNTAVMVFTSLNEIIKVQANPQTPHMFTNLVGSPGPIPLSLQPESLGQTFLPAVPQVCSLQLCSHHLPCLLPRIQSPSLSSFLTIP